MNTTGQFLFILLWNSYKSTQGTLLLLLLNFEWHLCSWS